MRDTCTPVRQLGRRRSRSRSRSRIFGLDASDRSRLDKNSDSEVEGACEESIDADVHASATGEATFTCGDTDCQLKINWLYSKYVSMSKD